jgi:hypothetical protein
MPFVAVVSNVAGTNCPALAHVYSVLYLSGQYIFPFVRQNSGTPPP